MNSTPERDPEIQFTEPQEKAITTLGKNLCVSAGAGSGKTSVLVERYLHLIEAGGLDVGEIVAITFTEKAANQMKEKIRNKIRNKMEHALSMQDRLTWERRYREIGAAWIHTIHGLCTRLLKENAVEAGVDPHFTTLDEIETTILTDRVVAGFVHERLNRDEESMVRLLTAYGLDQTRKIFTHLLRHREGAAAWAAEHARRSDAEILKSLRLNAEKQVALMVQDLERICCLDHTDKLEMLRQEMLDLLSGRELCAENLASVVERVKLNVGSKKKWGPEDFDRIKKSLGRLRDLSKSLVPLYDHRGMERELGLLRAIHQEVLPLQERYSAEKSAGGVLDFDDLILLARDLLTQVSEVRVRCRQELKALLMDELQDTDPLQMEIARLLCGEEQGRIFAVGDAKQSIYSFRGADVSVFLDFQESIRQTDAEAVISLHKNFRSQEKILTFINHLFSGIFPTPVEAIEDVPFTELEAHKQSLDRSHFVEGCFILTEKGEGATQRAREAEAERIAWRIQTMVENQEERVLVSPDMARPVEYRDIAILFRAMTDVKIYEAALRRLSIPFAVISGAGFFGKQEVLDALNMLRLLVYPQDEQALTAILRSPCVGVRDETLFFMTRGRSLHQGFQELEGVHGIDDAEKAVLARARDMLNSLQRVRGRIKIPELIGRFLDMTGYPALLLTDPVHGEQRYANLRKFMDLAREFSAKPMFGLSDFVTYIEELKEKEAREGESPIDEESDDTVRILTVHKAKGLEFPVVFLPDLSRTRGGKTDPVEIDRKYGLGIKVPDGQGAFADSYLRSRLMEKNKILDIQEEKRLFYVAATRAKDFLVLSGQISFPKDPKSNSAVPMTWLKHALGMTEENYRQDLSYGRGLVKVFPEIELKEPRGREAETWVEKHPEILQGALPDSGGDELALALMRQVKERPVARPPTRFSVSQLLLFQRCPKGYELSALHGLSEPEPEGHAPDRGGGRELGSLVHRVLQRWDFDASSLKECVDRELNRAALSPGRQKGIRNQALELVERFSQNAIADRIKRAEQVYKEVPFVLKLEGFLIEGVIDKLFRDKQGELTIIDYKTDRASAPEVPAKADEYRFQLAVYALAAQRLMREHVQTALAFLRPGILYPLRNDPGRAETEILAMIRKIRTLETFDKNPDRCPSCGYWTRFCKQGN